jgi:endo-alpha-1,4-polygalactosaminidase (GH114 family)
MAVRQRRDHRGGCGRRGEPLLRVLTVTIAAEAALLAACAPSTAHASQRIEAERMHVAPATGRVVRDASASGRRALVLVGRGSARVRVHVRASSRLTVVVRGQACSGAPRLVVATDGSRVLSRRVAGARWTPVSASAPVPAATHRTSVRLANPYRSGRCRRALRVDKLIFVSARARVRRWVPVPRTTWQWQLTSPVDQSVDAQMFDIDLFDSPASVVAALHAGGRHVVCYLDAGTLEPGRPDTSAFPAAVIGKELPDWPGEHWLDIRRLDVLAAVLQRRLDLCRRKGFDGVEADNVDAFANNSGFPLKAADQLRFNRFLARAAHARGLSIGLKNDLDQAATLQPDFDWALDEQCFQYSECERLQPFVRAGKAVFVVEYELDPASFCAQAGAAGFMAMRKHLELDAWRETCW